MSIRRKHKTTPEPMTQGLTEYSQGRYETPKGLEGREVSETTKLGAEDTSKQKDVTRREPTGTMHLRDEKVGGRVRW